ncbi:17952_t:CDS:2, partial [Cetraspora pellucida]
MSKKKQQQIEEVIDETSNKYQKTEQKKEKAFNIAFSNKDECLEFMKNLLHYYEAITSEFNAIENIIQLDRKHEYYVKMQTWKNERLNWALNDANKDVSNLKKLIKKLDKEKNHIKFYI